MSRATTRLLCWMVKVLDEKHESGCYSVPSTAKLVLLERPETLVGEIDAPLQGYQVAGLGTLKSQRGKSPGLLLPVPASPASSGFCGHKGGPQSSAGQPVRPAPLHRLVQELAS